MTKRKKIELPTMRELFEESCPAPHGWVEVEDFGHGIKIQAAKMTPDETSEEAQRRFRSWVWKNKPEWYGQGRLF